MKATITSPFAIREIAMQVERVLGLNLGIPMNAEVTNLPTACGEENEGTYTIHWECGWHVSGRAVVGIYDSLNGEYQGIRLVSLRFRRPFQRVNRRNGATNQPLLSNTMTVLETIGVSMEYTHDRFSLRLTEEDLGNVRHFAERFPEVKIG
jgi:hypothetical protein